MNPTYTEVKWKRGSVFKADPAQALKEIESLNLKYNGFAPDGALVKHAKSKRSVLHHEFEWDDSVAGHKYRLQTEKKIKRSLVVVTDHMVDKESNPIEVRVFTSALVSDEDNTPRRVYMNTFDMLEDPYGRQQLLEQAKQELEQFKRKYEMLSELSSVMKPIELFISEY